MSETAPAPAHAAEEAPKETIFDAGKAPAEKEAAPAPVNHGDSNGSFDTAWSSAELSKAVCDALVADGKIRTSPAFIRTDREAKITKTFNAAGLDGAKMATLNARGVETTVRKVTEGEGWVQDVEGALKAMLSSEAASSIKAEESEASKAIRASNLERIKELPPMDDRGLSAGGGRSDDRACFNCGQPGHLSKDCPEPRGSGGGGGGGGRGNEEGYSSFGGRSSGRDDMECYNCGGRGHMSRDCPEP